MESPLIIILSIACGALYAGLLYSAKNVWSQQTAIFMGIVRLIAVAILVFLLISPFIKLKKRITEKPVLGILLDNSRSALPYLSKQTLTDLKAFVERNQNKYRIHFFNLSSQSVNSTIDTLPFTPLSQAIDNFQNQFAGEKLDGLVIISDGIYNRGTSPLYNSYTYPIYTVGVGDTLAPKDIIIKNALYNPIVSLQSKAQIKVEISAKGFKDKGSIVNLSNAKGILQTQKIYFKNELDYQTIEFIVPETEAGLKRYEIKVNPLKDEFTIKNNKINIYYDVTETKQRILIAAAAPHPDIKALASSFQNKLNVQVDVYLPDINDLKPIKYDLVIFHQIPHQAGTGSFVLNKFAREGIPMWFIVGAHTALNELNTLLPEFRIMAQSQAADKVSMAVNENFTRFGMPDNAQNKLNYWPPAWAPYAEYNTSADWEYVLYQKVGSVTTNKPALAVNVLASPKIGVWLCEGLWQCRLQEFMETDQTQAFDGLVEKTASLLAQKDDKRKFIVRPIEREANFGESIKFQTDAFNDLYEKQAGITVELTITHENKQKNVYKYETQIDNNLFEVSGLQPGIYNYVAEATVNGKLHTVKGDFSVAVMDFESQNTVADFGLLRELAANTGGNFYTLYALDNLLNYLDDKEAEPKIYITETISEVIDLEAIFFVILLLLTFEWAARKWAGSY